MADPDQPSVKADAPTQPLSFIAELMQASPPVTRGSVFAILLASQINRVRLFQASRDGYIKVLERRVSHDAADSEAEEEAEDGRLPSLDQAVRDAMAELTNLGGVRSIDIALDLTVGSADGPLSTAIDSDPLLEGQDLSTLSSPGPVPATSVAEFELPTDESYLSAAAAAAMLGVAKSTITRRIEKGEIIGFRGFKKSLRIPEDQFHDGDVVAGVAEILALFECEDDGAAFDHKEAWIFLCSTLYPGDPAPRPIDRLRAASRERPTQMIVAELILVKESLDHGDHI